jgi:hypothetical protein
MALPNAADAGSGQAAMADELASIASMILEKFCMEAR